MAYEHAQGKGRAFPNTKNKHEKAPHFSGTCNPEGTQRELAVWVELVEGSDPAIIEKMKKVVKSFSVQIKELYDKDSAPSKPSNSYDEF